MSARPTDSVVRDLLANDAWVRALARRLVQDEHAAEDIVQDAWVAALQHPPGRTGSFRAWLERVVRNLALTRSRSAGRRTERESAAARPAFLPSPSEIRQHEQTRRELVEAVLALEEPYHSAVVYRYFRGLPPRIIASELGVPVETVKKRLSRGLEQLRARLDGRLGNRSSWRTALSAFAAAGAESAVTSGAPAVVGALVMGTKLKLTLAAVAIALGTALVLWQTEDEGPTGPTRPKPAPRAAAAKIDRNDAAAATDRRSAKPVAAIASDSRAAPEDVTVALDVERATIVGRVVDSLGAPLSGARVRGLRLVHGGTALPELVTTRTDRNGGYVLKPIGGRVVVEASADGHDTQRRVVDPYSRADFALGEPGELTGRLVCAPEGTPCVDATVGLYSWRVAYELERHSRIQFAWTHPPVAVTRSRLDGAFRFRSIPPGRYRLRVLPPGRPEVGTADLVADVRAGDAATIDIVVPRGACVAGRVTDEETGEPIPGALVSTLRRDQEPVITDDQGRFALWGVERSSFRFQQLGVRADGYAPLGRQLTRAAFTAGVFDVKLKRGVTIRGRVLGPDGEPVVGARVSTASSLLGPWAESARHRYPPALTDADGRFEWVTGKTEKERRIYAVKDGLGWGASAPFVPRGSEQDGVVVRLPRSGRIAGGVRDAGGRVVVGARVSLYEGATFRAETFTAHGGAYEMSGVSPGEYTIHVLPPGTPLEYDSPLAGRSRTGVVVKAGQCADVDVVLQLGATIAGEVADARGRPLDGVVVRAVTGGGGELLANFNGRPPRLRQTVTDAQGRYTLQGLNAERTYRIEAKKPGYEYGTAFRVAPGRDDVHLTLSELRLARGRVVVGGTGEPAIEFTLRGKAVAVDHRRSRIAFPNPSGAFCSLDGRFEFPVKPGAYTIRAETRDGRLSDDYPFTVPDNGESEPIELRVWPGASIVGDVRSRTGTIRSCNSVAVYDMGMRPARFVRHGVVDTSGRIDVRPLRPGRYLLTTRAMVGDVVQEGTVAVDVAAGSESRVSLVVDEVPPVAVVVRDGRGQSVGGATVRIRRSDGVPIAMERSESNLYRKTAEALRANRSTGNREAFEVAWKRAKPRLTTTAADGTLAPLLLIPGEYVVETVADGFKRDRTTVHIRPGGNTVTITLR